MELSDIQHWLDSRPADAIQQGVLRPGSIIDSWRVMTYLGHGLSSEVYRVENVTSGSEAALKLLVNDTADLRRRFINERKILSSLSPYIPELPGYYATGEQDGRLFYVMELLEPVELPLPHARIATFVLTLARAVAALHAAHYIHRDLKPANIMCRKNGQPVLIDFGLAKHLSPLEHNSPLTPLPLPNTLPTTIVDGHLAGLGTRGFAAPEQLIEGKCSIAGDIYSLAKIARACFKKRPPHRWRVIIRTATQDAPEDRFTSVSDFMSAIHRRNLLAHLLGAVAGLLLIAGLACRLIPGPPPINQQLQFKPTDTASSYIARITKFAQANNATAQCLLAEAYYHGKHTDKDLNQAYEWYHRAALNGATGAMVTLGDCYLHGHGHAKDPHEAIRWYREAARRGHLGAKANLGYCLINATGSDHDDVEGIQLITEAAKAGHAEAQRLLGECYLLGHGVDLDLVTGELWIRRAAEQGNRNAKKRLEIL